ncbi:MAG: glycosyltransferase family 4 protein [Candidatus Omnitrophica bacterium]|nr:glycosyltransferase family 4 protein [Candidatus Omnitrophota bacterium]MBU1924746.1 glycosyltransferase family 4 protein [Candidatus Omnitrophota bacterium]MBU2063738.1 glycosyltransferase family 4 protein [Candidatus Omnitrophota bacterium]
MGRIVFLTPQFKASGGNRVTVELSNELAAKGFDVDIVFPDNSDKTNSLRLDKKITVYKIGRYKNNKIFKLFNLLRSFLFVRKNKKGALVIISDPIMCIALFFLKGLKVYRFIQGDDYGLFDDRFLIKNKLILYIFKFLTKVSFRYKSAYLFNSRFSYDVFLRHSRRTDIQCRIIHPAINHAVFYDKNIRPANLINLCLIGRKHPFKGLDDFLGVWRKNRENLSKKISRVYIISGDELSQFDLSDFELIAPDRDSQIVDIYNKSHIFISASWNEGFSLPPLEAMACGCAVILADSGGVNEYAVHGENCLMYEPRNREQLMAKLTQLLDSSLLIQELKLNGKMTARNFSWEKSAQGLISMIGA